MRQRTTTFGGALLLVLLIVFGLLLGPPKPAQAIANGQTVPQGRYPFAVKLTMNDIPAGNGEGRDSSCSGSLLTPQWVITAGHCFKNSQGAHVSRTVAKLTTATVGRADLGGKAGRVSKVVAVRQSRTTDVALAKIDPPITDIAPIHLRKSAPKVGTVVQLVGYGDTGRGEPVAKRLQGGQFKVVSRTGKLLGVTGYKPRSTTSPCAHDSGGPYFTQETGGPAELVAVVSYGPDCPHSEVDESARIDTIADWIASTVGARNLNRPALAAPPSAPARAERSAAAPPAAAPRVPAAHQNPLGGGLIVWSAAAGLAVTGLVMVGIGAARRRARSRRRRVPQTSRGVRSHRRA